MRRSDKETTSFWAKKEGIRHPEYASLNHDLKADICVIGAGIAGLTTAYLLQKYEGKSVVAIDAWTVGAGETGRTTAHVTYAYDDGYAQLEKQYSHDELRIIAGSHKAAIDRIENIIADEHIDCDFERVDGYLTSMAPDQDEKLKTEASACERAGLSELTRMQRIPLEQIKGGKTLCYPAQATFDIAGYMAGLATAFQKCGGQIFTKTRAAEIHDGDHPYVETESGHRIDTASVIVATNTPVNDWVKMHTKQAAYRSYVLAFKIPKGSYPGFLLWDLANPYHYARIARGDAEDYLIVGGEDHKTGQANDADARYRRIENWSRAHFSGIGPVIARWSGQIMEPVDHLAFIGRNPGGKNVYIVTGDSGNGITHGTIAGMLIPDLIQGRENPWAKLYDPARISLKSAGTYIKENTNFVGCMVSDWAAPGEVESTDEIRPGEGAIMRKGLSKVAVFKDESGDVQECSAVCTHLGCVVQWNAGEKSWDCPCHGSRFDTEGKVLNGPAIKALGEAEPSVQPAAEQTSEKSQTLPPA